MQKVEISGAYRETRGKGPARQLRAIGQVPAVLYSKGTSTLLQVNPKEINRILNSPSGENSLITLVLSQGKEGYATSRLAVLKAVQRNPVSESLVHVDLFEISLSDPITLRIPIEITGLSVGVKGGGILQHSTRDLEVRCLPAIVPDRISVDVTALKIGDSIHQREIVLGEGIELLGDPNQSIVSVVPPISEAKMDAILATGPKDIKAPEVTKQKDKEEIAAAPAKGGGGKGDMKKEVKKAPKDAKK